MSNKDELRDKASDVFVGKVFEQTGRFTGEADPIGNLRGMAITAFDAICERPWLADRFMQGTVKQPNSLRLYERFG